MTYRDKREKMLRERKNYIYIERERERIIRDASNLCVDLGSLQKRINLDQGFCIDLQKCIKK